MELGKKLKSARTVKGMTQEELAESLQVTRQSISNWENNRSYPDIASMIKLSEICDISLDELLKEDNKAIEFLSESTNLVKSKNRFSRLIEIISFLIIWCLCIILLFISRYSNDAAPFAAVFYYILPVSSFIISIFIGSDKSWGNFKWNIPFVFGLMYLLAAMAHYATRYDNIRELFGIIPRASSIFIPMCIVISYIGLIIGYFFTKCVIKRLQKNE